MLHLQSLGEDVSSVYVKEFGRQISKDVEDMMMCVVEVDWRGFFPYLSWVPNKSFDTRVAITESRRTAVMGALINQRKERIACGEVAPIHIAFNICILFSSDPI
jgi:ent-kaurene oxidase